MRTQTLIRPSLILCALGRHKPGPSRPYRDTRIAWCVRCRTAQLVKENRQ